MRSSVGPLDQRVYGLRKGSTPNWTRFIALGGQEVEATVREENIIAA